MIIVDKKGITLIELLIVLSIIGILAIIGIPEISRFSSTYKARSCATDLIQNMKVAKAMAIKENREYLITFDTANNRYMMGFDSNNDGDLLDLNQDGFGICGCVDADLNGRIEGNERIPAADADTNPADGVPDCVKVVNVSDCGNNIIFGYGSGTTPPNGPNATTIPASGIDFTGTPPTAEFDSDGSMDKLGSAYFQQTTRGYSYCVRISNQAGALNMWKWDGDKDNTGVTSWTELR